MENLRTEMSSLFDCPELQCYRVRPVPVDTFLFLNELDLVRSSRSSGTHRYARQEANTFICSGCRWYLVENGWLHSYGGNQCPWEQQLGISDPTARFQKKWFLRIPAAYTCVLVHIYYCIAVLCHRIGSRHRFHGQSHMWYVTREQVDWY